MKSDFAFRREPGKQNGVSYVYLFFSMLLLFVAGAFFQEHIVVFNKTPSVFMNDSEFFVSFAMVLFAIISFLLIVQRNFRIKIQWGWLILFFILFVSNAVGLFSLESTVDLGNGSFYTFTVMQRIQFMLLFGVSCTYFYLFIVIFPKIFHNVRFLHIVCYGLLILNAAALVFSFIAEGNLWITAFQPDAPWLVSEICSFTNNPNQFALFPLIGAMAVMLLHNRRSHWYWYLTLFILGIIQLFIGSGSGIIATWAMIFIFVFYRFGVTLKYHTGASLLGMFFFLVAIGVAFLFMFTGIGGPGFILTRMGNMLKNNHFHPLDRGNGRFPIWNMIFHSLDTPLKWVCGVGDTQSLFYLQLKLFPSKPGPMYYAHNGIFQQLFSGGLVRLLVLLIVSVRQVYLCFMGIKSKARVSWPCLIATVGLLIRGGIETNGFLFADGNAFIIYVLIQLPVEVIHFRSKHPEVAGYEIAAKADLPKRRYAYDYSPLRMAKVTFMVLAPIVAIMLGMFPQFFRVRLFSALNAWPFYAMMAEVFFLAPLLMYCIGYHTDRSDRRTFGTLAMVGFLGCITLGLFMMSVNMVVTYMCMGFSAFIVLITFLLHVKSFFQFREKLFLHAYLPHLCITGTLVGLSTLGFLVPDVQFSPYIPFMMGITIFTMYVCCYYTRHGEDMTRPLFFKFRHVDCRMTAKNIIAEEKMTAQQDHYLTAGHGVTRAKRTYVERLD